MSDRLKRIVAEVYGIDTEKITPELRFEEDLGSDSLDITELVMETETEFDIVMTDDDAEAIKTFADLEAFVTKKAGSA